MNPKLIQLLVKLRILDPDASISLSNLLMIVLIVKVAMAPVLDLAIVSTLFVTLLNYSAKKFNHYKTSKDKQVKVDAEEAFKAAIADTQKQITDLANLIKLRKL